MGLLANTHPLRAHTGGEPVMLRACQALATAIVRPRDLGHAGVVARGSAEDQHSDHDSEVSIGVTGDRPGKDRRRDTLAVKHGRGHDIRAHCERYTCDEPRACSDSQAGGQTAR